MDSFADKLERSRKDSDLRRGDPEYWKTYNSSIEDYEDTFKDILEGKRIIDFVKDKPGPVIIDLMSSTKALESLFEQLPQSNKLGVAVSLEDDRDQEAKMKDKKMGIEHIPGDLGIPETWKRLARKLAGRKADLIIERGGMGTAYIPTDERFYGYVLNRIWENISENEGVILIQGTTTHSLRQAGIRFNEWVDLIKGQGVNTVFSEGNDNLGFDYAYLKLVRTPQSPAILPLL